MNDKDFKQQLYQKFARAGLDKDIRAKVAEKLVQELKATPPLASVGNKSTVPHQKDLRNQILVSLIGDFLDRRRCYTAKDVLEAELECPQVLTKDELEAYFNHIPSVSVESNSASKIFATKQPLTVLERLVGNTIYQRTVDKLSRAVQTEEDENYSLHNKLKAVDERFAAMASNEKKPTSASKISELEALMRQEYQSMLRREMLSFKETELRNYRITVDRESDQKYRDREIALEKSYTARLSSLKEREKMLYETLERKANDLEKATHDDRRQQLMKLMDIEEREKGLSKERQIRLADIEAREFKLTEQERQLDIRMKEIDSLKSELAFNNLQLEKRLQVNEVY